MLSKRLCASKNRLLIWFALTASLAACGASEFYLMSEVPSPDGVASLRVLRNLRGFSSDYRFRVDVLDATGTYTVYRREKESSIGFIEVYWSPNSKQVGYFVCDQISGPHWGAYDLNTKRPLPRETFRTVILSNVRTKYRLSESEDPLQWACSSAGTRIF